MSKKELFCPVEITLGIVAGRWKVIAIHHLLEGPKRFNQLQRMMNGITHRTLIKQLREMEDHGLVQRKDYGEIPPRVDYSLTKLGASLEPVLRAMDAWGTMHAKECERVKATRAKV